MSLSRSLPLSSVGLEPTLGLGLGLGCAQLPTNTQFGEGGGGGVYAAPFAFTSAPSVPAPTQGQNSGATPGMDLCVGTCVRSRAGGGVVAFVALV